MRPLPPSAKGQVQNRLSLLGGARIAASVATRIAIGRRVRLALDLGGAGLGGVLGLLLLQRAVAGDVLVVLFERRGKDVAAGAVGDEIEVVGLGRVGDGLERRTAGIGDRRRRQAVDQIGVVGRLLVDVRLVDRAIGGLPFPPNRP